MAFEMFTMNPPKRRFKFGASKRRKSYRKRSSRVSITGLLKGRRRKGLRKSSSKLWSALRRGRAKYGRNAEGMDIMTLPSKMSQTLAAYSAGGLAAVVTGKPARKHKKSKAAKKAGAKRYGGTRRTTRKGSKKMARRRGRRVHRIGKRASRRKVGVLIARARRHKSPLSWLKRRGFSKSRLKRYMGTRRRVSKFARSRPIHFTLGHRRLAANRRRSRRRSYARNGLTTWQKLVKSHGVKGAKRLYRGNRKSRSRRRYRKNRELYQIGPVAANRPRRHRRSYRRNRELYQVSPGFSANPTTAIMAFPKAVLNVGFLTKNVLPLAAGAIGSKLVAGLITSRLLKDKKWTNAPWKEAAWVAASGVVGGIGIGLATKGKKADWAYKFAAGGMLSAIVTLFDAYMKKTMTDWGFRGIGEYSGIGYGSDDLKRRIAEELKTELDGVSGFITQEDMDRGISSSSGAVSGFVTSEDLPNEGSSISMDDFAATASL